MYQPDTDQLLQFKISKDELLDLYPYEYPEYSFDYLTKDNYREFDRDLNRVVDHHHKDLEGWDGIPDYRKLEQRFAAGSTCYVVRYNDITIGWAWANRKLTYNWIDIVKDMPENSMYMGGIFVTRNEKRPAHSSMLFLSKWYPFMVKNEKLDYMYGYTDKWNKASSWMNRRLGWKEQEWMQLYI